MADSKQEVERRILQYIGLKLETETKKRCPVDTGRLRASYSFYIKGNGTLVFGTNVYYGPYVEFGTDEQRPQPHVRPAIDATRNALNL